MTTQRIRRLVFWTGGLLSNDGSPLAGMPALVAELAQIVDVWAVGDQPQADRMRRETAYATSVPGARIVAMQAAEHAAFFNGLMKQGVIEPGSTLWVDADGRRAMAAIRSGIDAALFEGADRLYRDLGLWGLVPLIHDLGRVRHHLKIGEGR